MNCVELYFNEPVKNPMKIVVCFKQSDVYIYQFFPI